MITVRAGSGAIGVCLLLLVAGCSREQQDWRSAEAADTIEAYGQFIQRHPESELATQARTRVAQLGEDRDWQHAGSADSVEAYRDFIAQHPNGKWAQEAHIRIENFSLGEQAAADASSKAASGSGPGAGPSTGSSASPGPSSTGRNTASVAAKTRTGAVGTPAAADPSAPGPNATGGTSGTAAPNVDSNPHVASSGARSYALASPGEAASPAALPTAHSPAGSANAGADAASQSPGGPQGASASATNHSPAPRNAATAPSASAAKGAFGIQLGAFTTEASANTEWRLLASRYAPDLQGLQEHVVPVDTASGRIYRLQAAVGDEGRARSICNSLRNRGQACVAVLPH
jgi:hypothetical protein